MIWSRRGVFVGLLGVALLAGVGRIAAQEGSAKKEPKPKKPPRGAIVLFGGKSTEAWGQIGRAHV